MNKISKWLVVASIFATMSAHAQLASVDGGLGVYEADDNVTWASDGDLMFDQARSFPGGVSAFINTMNSACAYSLACTSAIANGRNGIRFDFFNDPYSGIFPGTMTWGAATEWVNYLNTTDYGGSNQWTLPTTTSVGNNLISSQFGQLFIGNLGQAPGSNIATTHNSNLSLFNNIESETLYWSSACTTLYCASTAPGADWYFYPSSGQVGNNAELLALVDGFAMAVTPGDLNPTAPVAAPEIDPASVASGLTLLMGALVLLGGRRKLLPA